jgi:hypothetical protein
MPLPDFNSRGELPEGVHQASLVEVLERFGHGTPQRQLVTSRLVRGYELGRRTGKLERFVIFGSYVTAKPAPQDVDIILVMRDDFSEPECDEQTRAVFNHTRAQKELGASIFWTCVSGVLVDTLDEFIAHWQLRRDLGRRGIVEITTGG